MTPPKYIIVFCVLLLWLPLFSFGSDPTAAQQKLADDVSDRSTKLQRSIAGSQQVRATADADGATLANALKDFPDSAPDRLKGISIALVRARQDNVLQLLGDRTAAVTQDRDELVTACAQIQVADDSPRILLDADTSCKKMNKAASDELSLLNSSNSDFTTKLKSILPTFSAGLASFQQALPDLSPDSPGLSSLPGSMSKFVELLSRRDDLSTAWKGAADCLSSFKISVPGDQDPETTIFPKLDSVILQKAQADFWKNAIGLATQKSVLLEQRIPQVLQDPAGESNSATELNRDATQTLAQLRAILNAWPPLRAAFVSAKLDFKSSDADANAQRLSAAVSRLNSVADRLTEALTGDLGSFVTENVPLFYFTDVTRIVRTLNPAFQEIGGVADAQRLATGERTKLLEAEASLSEAQAAVNALQKKILDLKEQRREQDALITNLGLRHDALTSKISVLQRHKDKTTARQAEAESNTHAAPDDKGLAAKLKSAKAEDSRLGDQIQRASSDLQSNDSQLDAAKKARDADDASANSLPAQIAEAEKLLEAAQQQVADRRKAAVFAAQRESDAFAYARDNAPYLYAPAVATSTDPGRRVIIYAFLDNKTILLRGKATDVEAVKTIIAEFDKPAPQSRLTLWSLEVSGSLGSSGSHNADKLNKALAILDDELSNSRARVSTSLSLLRTLINDKVQLVENDPAGEGCIALEAGKKLDAPDGLTSDEKARWSRMHFYSPDVVGEAHLKFDSAQSFRFSVLPDPSATTTIGEAILVLSLSCEKVRKDIIYHFRTSLETRLKELDLAFPGKGTDSFGWKKDKCISPFSLTAAALGAEKAPLSRPGSAKQGQGQNEDKNNSDQGTKGKKATAKENCEADPSKLSEFPNVGITANQLELVRALRAGGYRKVFTLLASYKKRIEALQLEDAELRKSSKCSENSGTQTADSACPGADAAKKEVLLARSLQINRELSDLSSRVRRLLSSADQAWDLHLSATTPKTPSDSSKIENNPGQEQPDIDAYGKEFGLVNNPDWPNMKKRLELQNQMEQEFPAVIADVLQSTTPRVAAADQMLKEMIMALEDDLDRMFIQKLITRLRSRLMRESKVQVGIVQRSSLLATNRLQARIDPTATSQLSVGEEQDLIGGLQQLATIYTATQAGGPLGALAALNKQAREPQAAIYGLTTGNKFQVTPIFDPSGQALRFKFDFVSNTRIQEPNGTVNPQMPSIRNTVNTEVQLSTLETREVARFESNARLGLPTKYSGGIPILKDIPYVRPVPLIGWFVRTAGSNAAVQQHIVFGQTTIYPTISSLVGLAQDTLDLKLDGTQPSGQKDSQATR